MSNQLCRLVFTYLGMWYILFMQCFFMFTSVICIVDGFYYINTILINFKCEFDRNAQLSNIVRLYKLDHFNFRFQTLILDELFICPTTLFSKRSTRKNVKYFTHVNACNKYANIVLWLKLRFNYVTMVAIIIW